MSRLTRTLAMALVGAGTLRAGAQTIAITGGTVYSVTGAPITNGTVLMRDGRIVAVGWGDFEVMSTSAPEVLAIRYDWRGTSLLTLHNFAGRQVKSAFDLKVCGADLLVDVFNANGDSQGRSGRHELTLEPYAWRWFRVGVPDNAVHRASR